MRTGFHRVLSVFAAAMLTGAGAVSAAQTGLPDSQPEPSRTRAGDGLLSFAYDYCVKAIRAHPKAPAGFDAEGTCRCAIDTAYEGQADPVTFAATEQGKQALTDAIVSCGRERLDEGGSAQQPAAGDDSPDSPGQP